jgi:hypothetical protein
VTTRTQANAQTVGGTRSVIDTHAREHGHRARAQQEEPHPREQMLELGVPPAGPGDAQKSGSAGRHESTRCAGDDLHLQRSAYGQARRNKQEEQRADGQPAPEADGASADRLPNVAPTSHHDLVRAALRIILEPQHLRRTLTIALVVGTVLTAINQADVIARGDATATTLVKAVLNYLVPFIVSNLGLLVGTRDERSPQ